jgi:hypothetical protein
MSDRRNTTPPNTIPESALIPDGDSEQEIEYEDMPVDELIRLARAVTQRLNDEDRKRLAQEVKVSEQHHSIQTKAPITLQQFFTGEIDLDTELAQRFSGAPLLSAASFYPKDGESAASRRHTAFLTTQDNAAMVTIELPLKSAEIEATFTLNSMLSFRFNLGALDRSDQQRWLSLMRRSDGGIAFLWSKDRWEKDYMIFVVRQHFTRLYAFSPNKFEAAARITPDLVEDLLKWLEHIWLGDTISAPVRKIPPPQAFSPPPAPPPVLPRPTLVDSSPIESQSDVSEDSKDDESGSAFEW